MVRCNLLSLGIVKHFDVSTATIYIYNSQPRRRGHPHRCPDCPKTFVFEQTLVIYISKYVHELFLLNTFKPQTSSKVGRGVLRAAN